MKNTTKATRPEFATYKLYTDDMNPVLAIHSRDLKKWEKKKVGPKPWIADAFKKFVSGMTAVLCLTSCTPVSPDPPPATCTPETVEFCQDTVVTNVKGGIEGVGK